MKRISFLRRAAAATAVATTAMFGALQTAHAEPMRIGYWTSGVSLGFGAVLEVQKFLQQPGLDVVFIRCSDVNAPNRPPAAHAIDLAFSPPAAPVLSRAA